MPFYAILGVPGFLPIAGGFSASLSFFAGLLDKHAGVSDNKRRVRP